MHGSRVPVCSRTARVLVPAGVDAKHKRPPPRVSFQKNDGVHGRSLFVVGNQNRAADALGGAKGSLFVLWWTVVSGDACISRGYCREHHGLGCCSLRSLFCSGSFAVSRAGVPFDPQLLRMILSSSYHIIPTQVNIREQRGKQAGRALRAQSVVCCAFLLASTAVSRVC